MSRHSKNNTASSVFTYHERKMVKDFGKQKARIGVDSQTKFGFCPICLHFIQEPMCCLSGHIFCKSCIVESLVHQKKDWEVSQKDRKEVEYLKMKEKEQKEKHDHQQELSKFEHLEYDSVQTIKAQLQKNAKMKLEGYLKEDELQRERAIEYVKDKGRQMLTTSKEILVKQNFWLPENLKDIEREPDVDKQRKCVLFCPQGGEPIMMKKLFKIEMMRSNEEVLCNICRVQLKYQKIYVNPKCGHMLCNECTEQIKKDKVCSVCNEEVKDLVSICTENSGFVSHNAVEVIKYTPYMLI